MSNLSRICGTGRESVLEGFLESRHCFLNILHTSVYHIHSPILFYQKYSPPIPDSQAELPIVYKKSITFFRSLYAYVRLLPMFGLFKRLSMKLTQSLKIGHRFVLPNANTRDDVGIGGS